MLGGADAVQPAVVTAPGLAAGAPSATQLGGIAIRPTADAWPRPPNIGTPPKPAEPAGAPAPVRVPSNPAAVPLACAEGVAGLI